MFHIVTLLLFPSNMFATVYQFWFNKNYDDDDDDDCKLKHSEKTFLRLTCFEVLLLQETVGLGPLTKPPRTAP